MPKGQSYGGPRQKLLGVLRQSGVSDSAAVRLSTEALGPAPRKKKVSPEKKKRRASIIAALKSIGAQARSASLSPQSIARSTARKSQAAGRKLVS